MVAVKRKKLLYRKALNDKTDESWKLYKEEKKSKAGSEGGKRERSEESGKDERMLEGEGGEQEGKCGGKGADRGMKWKETKRTPQEEMERSLLRL